MDTQSIASGAKGYPFLLEKTFDPPKLLYYKGTLPNRNLPLLAVVGSRKITPYGVSTIKKILPPIIRAGVGIVSGLAYGIDTEALTIALEHGGKAFGVIGGGMDAATFYPRQNIALSQRMILAGGALFSEYPEGHPPLPKQFAIRNRIIAGMCHATLVVEAAKKSGSLITAEVALNENREVFTIPNSIFHKKAEGTNELLKHGAHLVTESKDILSVLGLDSPKSNVQSIKNTTPNKVNVFDILTNEPKHIDIISKELHLTASEAGARLSALEIQGVAKNVGGMYYIRI